MLVGIGLFSRGEGAVCRSLGGRSGIFFSHARFAQVRRVSQWLFVGASMSDSERQHSHGAHLPELDELCSIRQGERPRLLLVCLGARAELRSMRQGDGP